MSATAMTTTQNISTTANPWPYVALDLKQGLILFLITLPGTLANIVAFLTTLKVTREQKKVAPNYLILALNLTDFYGIVFCTLPTLLCYLHKRWVGGNAMCNFQSVSTMFASLASGILATAMATDRLLAVWKPFLYKKHVTMRRTFFTVTATWLGALVVAISPLAGYDFFVKNLTGTYCTINWFAKETANQVYAVFYAIIGITMVAIVVFCNVKIVVTLLAQRKKRGALHGLEMEEHVDDGRKKSEMQLVKSVGAVSALFIICWFPFMIRIICNLTGVWVNAWVDVQVSRLLLLNFVLDPFLYTLSRKQCRDIVKGWLCCCFASERFRRSSLFSRFFARMRKKRGSFLSSNQTGSGTNLNSTTSTSNIQMARIKTGSVTSTPDLSVSTDAVVVHVSGNQEPGNIPEKKEVNANGSNSENSKENSSDDLFRKCHSDASAFKKPQMQRLHSEMGAKIQAGLQEKTSSLPNLVDADNHDESEDVKVDIGYMYDLAYQRQTSK